MVSIVTSKSKGKLFESLDWMDMILFYFIFCYFFFYIYIFYEEMH